MDQFPSRYCLRLPGAAQILTGPTPFLVQFCPSSTFSLPQPYNFCPFVEGTCAWDTPIFYCEWPKSRLFVPHGSDISLSTYAFRFPTSLHWAVRRHKQQQKKTKHKSSPNKRLVDHRKIYPRCILLLNFSIKCQERHLVAAMESIDESLANSLLGWWWLLLFLVTPCGRPFAVSRQSTESTVNIYIATSYGPLLITFETGKKVFFVSVLWILNGAGFCPAVDFSSMSCLLGQGDGGLRKMSRRSKWSKQDWWVEKNEMVQEVEKRWRMYFFLRLLISSMLCFLPFCFSSYCFFLLVVALGQTRPSTIRHV